MKGLEYLAGVGIAAVILFAVIFITGLILLIVSVVKTVKGKQKIGGIIAGSIMTVLGFILMFYFGMLLIFGGFAYGIASNATATGFEKEFGSVLEDEDSNKLFKLFAKEGYSGDALTQEDADEICELIDNTKFRSVTPTGTSWHNDVKAINYKCVFADKKTNKTITLNASYIVQASNGDYIGIQYIQVSKDSVKEEFGTKPKLN